MTVILAEVISTTQLEQAQQLDSLMLMNTRRRFIRDCSAGTVAALMAKPSLFANCISPAAAELPVQDLNYSAFAAQLNTHFAIHARDGRSVPVKLVEVRRPLLSVPSTSPVSGYERFSLYFRGARHEMLPQENYRFEHLTLGSFQFFIVPIHTRNPEEVEYEAVIWRPYPSRVGTGATEINRLRPV